MAKNSWDEIECFGDLLEDKEYGTKRLDDMPAGKDGVPLSKLVTTNGALPARRGKKHTNLPWDKRPRGGVMRENLWSSKKWVFPK